MQLLKSHINAPNLFAFIDFIYLLVFAIIYKRKDFKKNNLVNYVVFMILTGVIQLISICIRNINIKNQLAFNNNFIIGFVLNLDYLITLIIIYKLYFMKGGKKLWDLVVSYGLQKLISLKSLLANLHVKSVDKKCLSKEDKITYLIYFPLYLLFG